MSHREEERARRLYRLLLGAYPPEHRERYGPEMEDAFLALLRLDEERSGTWGRLRCWTGAVTDALLRGTAVRLGLAGGGVRETKRLKTGVMKTMGTMLSDARYALRALFRRPVFAATAILTIALGIGANASVFTLVDGFLFTPLPYEDPQELVSLWGENPELGWSDTDISPANAWDWRERASALEDLAVFYDDGFNMTGDGTPELVWGLRVTPNVFRLLGRSPVLGRDFLPEEIGEGNDRVAVLTHGFWQRRFGGDPDVLGSILTLDGLQYTVVGITPPDFVFLDERPDLFVPMDVHPTEADRDGHYGEAVARLADGATLERARKEVVGGARQVLTESLVLAVLGGGLGLLLAVWGYKGIVAALPSNLPPVFRFGLDGSVLALVVGITVPSALIFGVAPALKAGEAEMQALREGGRGSQGRSTGRMGSTLVVVQTAMAVILLVGGGLLMKSLSGMRNQDFGFDPDNVLTVRIAPPGSTYPEAEDLRSFWNAVEDRVAELPGVVAVGRTQSHPLMGSNWGRTITIAGQEDTERTVRLTYTSPGLFDALGFRVLEGRGITEAVPAVQEAVWSVDPNIPLYDVETMEALVERRIGGFAVIGYLMGTFALLSLILGAVGIYGVTAYAAGQRTGEIGVRMAMGAERGDVVRMVVAQGGRRAVLGLIIGLVGAFLLTGAMGQVLVGVSPRDPVTFLGVTLVLGVVSFLGLWLPARRAARVDPVRALASE